MDKARRLIDNLKVRVLFYQHTNNHNLFVASRYEHKLLYILDMLHQPEGIEDLKDEIVAEIESALQERPLYRDHYYSTLPSQAKEQQR
jgi:hypothetical protein